MSVASTLHARGLKLSHLSLIAALAETGQVGLAARRLGIAQPAASRLLSEIRRIVGYPVAERTGRGLTLTPGGEALARRAARVLVEIGEAGREIEELARGHAGHVRVGSVTGPAMDRLLPAIQTARLSYPRVSIEVEVAMSDALSGLLLAGRIDFAIGRAPAELARDEIDLEPMGEEPVSLVVRRGHALAGRRQAVAPEELLAYDWILPGPEAILRRSVEHRLAALGLPQPRGQVSTSSFLLTLALIQQSNAIAPLATAVATQFVRDENAPFAILPETLGIAVEAYGMMLRRGTRLTPAADLVRRLILDVRPPAAA